jgi:hypothetical protein
VVLSLLAAPLEIPLWFGSETCCHILLHSFHGHTADPHLKFQKESKVAWSEIRRIWWLGDGWNVFPHLKGGVTGHSVIVQELIVTPWPTAPNCSNLLHRTAHSRVLHTPHSSYLIMTLLGMLWSFLIMCMTTHVRHDNFTHSTQQLSHYDTSGNAVILPHNVHGNARAPWVSTTYVTTLTYQRIFCKLSFVKLLWKAVSAQDPLVTVLSCLAASLRTGVSKQLVTHHIMKDVWTK